MMRSGLPRPLTQTATDVEFCTRTAVQVFISQMSEPTLSVSRVGALVGKVGKSIRAHPAPRRMRRGEVGVWPTQVLSTARGPPRTHARAAARGLARAESASIERNRTVIAAFGPRVGPPALSRTVHVRISDRCFAQGPAG